MPAAVRSTMHITARGIRRLPLAAALGALALAAACDDLGGRKMPMTPAETTPAGPGPAADAAAGQPRSGSASTLGKARDSAVKVGDKVDDYNKKLEDAAGEIGK